MLKFVLVFVVLALSAQASQQSLREVLASQLEPLQADIQDTQQSLVAATHEHEAKELEKTKARNALQEVRSEEAALSLSIVKAREALNAATTECGEANKRGLKDLEILAAMGLKLKKINEVTVDELQQEQDHTNNADIKRVIKMMMDLKSHNPNVTSEEIATALSLLEAPVREDMLLCTARTDEGHKRVNALHATLAEVQARRTAARKVYQEAAREAELSRGRMNTANAAHVKAEQIYSEEVEADEKIREILAAANLKKKTIGTRTASPSRLPTPPSRRSGRNRVSRAVRSHPPTRK